MDRASDSGSEGWGFESLPVYQSKIIRTISSKSEAGSDYLFISHNRNKGCRFGSPCLFILFPFRKPECKFILDFWLCIIGSNIIEYASSKPLNGILRNGCVIYEFLFSSHINGPFKVVCRYYRRNQISLRGSRKPSHKGWVWFNSNSIYCAKLAVVDR